ncbi:hypothetical protein HELRODRAFT_141530, partial [Helobdella robusta]|uniref:GAR domain-containing protein n=1 Tax=Helobdella robusta TaxID=6412 RepID=T1EJ35_HELRO
KSVKPFKTKDEYLYAMKEDLAEWFHDLYNLPVTVDNFFEHLDNGTLLCKHANTILKNTNTAAAAAATTTTTLTYRNSAQIGTFQARDNISTFIAWCRSFLGIPDTILFETEDLVSRKNERNVVLCLLEVGRRGSKFGVLAPQLVQLEKEIDDEIASMTRTNGHSNTPKLQRSGSAASSNNSVSKASKPAPPEKIIAKKPVIEVDMLSLDEMVRLILSRCRCEHQYPMIRLSEGRYTYGDNLTPIFMRVLRRHVMVRTGGGWDTLESFLDRHDPCRCNS